MASHCTVVPPSANWLPDAGVQVTVTDGSTASLTSGASNGTIAPVLLVASTATSACACNTGAVLSATVILKLALAWLPAESLAAHCTVVAPSANTLTDGGVQPSGYDVRSSTASNAVAA